MPKKPALTFQDRLEWVREVGNLRVADLARWFDRPYSTVNSWKMGHKPMGPPGDVREVFATLVQIEEAIRQKQIPLPVMPSSRRLMFLKKIKGRMKRAVI